jgi:uncharacterized protein (TIGR02246 family)
MLVREGFRPCSTGSDNRRYHPPEEETMMLARFFRMTEVLGSSLLVAMLITALPAAAQMAQSSQEITGAAAKWAAIFVDDNPDSILALYDDEAVLSGTLSPKLLVGKPELRGYFERAFKALPGHKVAFGEQVIRVYGDVAINSGYYTFSYLKDGQTQSIPARYSFVYRKRGGKWMIVDHHSSRMPAN